MVVVDTQHSPNQEWVLEILSDRTQLEVTNASRPHALQSEDSFMPGIAMAQPNK
jgi:hypothetical protein